MKRNYCALILLSGISLSFNVLADLAGSTYTLTSPYSLYTATSDVTISSVIASPYTTATLVISNANSTAINVNWAAPGRAIGVGTTNQISLPGGQIAEINVNASLPGLIIYSTQQEQIMPALTANDTLKPELLYYAMTEGSQAYPINSGYFENTPAYLADSSRHGGTTGTITANAIPVQWVPDQNGTVARAVHFNGSSTKLDTGNPSLFNFTTNVFSINIWVRNLTYPCAICGTGLWRNYGWYIDINPAGEIVVAAENPNSDQYVATTSTVAFAAQWFMLTVVRPDTNTILIYRNGVLQNTVGSFGNPAPCNNSLIFGADYSGNQYDGDLGPIRIYSHALSANEINAIYLNESTP